MLFFFNMKKNIHDLKKKKRISFFPPQFEIKDILRVGGKRFENLLCVVQFSYVSFDSEHVWQFRVLVHQVIAAKDAEAMARWRKQKGKRRKMAQDPGDSCQCQSSDSFRDRREKTQKSYMVRLHGLKSQNESSKGYIFFIHSYKW